MLWSESIPNYNYTDINGRQTDVEVIVGKLASKKAPTPPPDSWAFDAENEVAIWNIRMGIWSNMEITHGLAGIKSKIILL